MRQTHYLFLFLFLLQSVQLTAQNVIESRFSSPYHYIYSLTNEEAEQVLTATNWELKPSYLHSLVDSFPTGEVYQKQLPQGHYLTVYTHKNRLQTKLASIADFYVKILNNQTDLMVQVIDSANVPISTAQVKVGGRKLAYDQKTQTYRIAKANQKGLMAVNYQGMSLYQSLNRTQNNSRFKRIAGTFLYRTPVRYVWQPARFLVSIPVDGVRSIVNGSARGSIYKLALFPRKFARWTAHKARMFAGAFNAEAYNYEDKRRFKNKFKGYFVMNKPKFRMQDTVKCKLALFTQKGKAFGKPLKAVLINGGKKIDLGEIQAYRDGGYTFEFVLHDSLNLTLDRSYKIALLHREELSVFSANFYLEDYELRETNFSMKVDKNVHYRGKSVTFRASVTDENDLAVPDASIQLYALRTRFNKFFQPKGFIPDTLWSYKEPLGAKGELEIAVPDSVLPNANFSYQLVARMTTSDNEYKEQKFTVSFYEQRQLITSKLKQDTVSFNYLKDGKEMPVQGAKLMVFDLSNHIIHQEKINLPHQLIVDPLAHRYQVTYEKIKHGLPLKYKSAGIQCYTRRDADSVWIEVRNPKKIGFAYQIYKKNSMIKRGYAKSLKWADRTSTPHDYAVSVQYVWGGKEQAENYSIPAQNPNELSVNLIQPSTVYPGQSNEITVEVTDKQGKPVANADVTAWALTNKFNYQPPTLPIWQELKKGRKGYNSFNKKPITHNKGKVLAFHEWKNYFDIDTIPYYQFTYPRDSIFSYSYPTDDSITQFAPFVMKNGAPVSVEVIYIDHEPVYVHCATNKLQPYSFRADSGYHRIQLRTGNQEITLRRVYLPYGKKTILSVDSETFVSLAKNITKEEKPSQPTEYEQSLLSKMLMHYEIDHLNTYSYIEQNDRIYPLTTDGWYPSLSDMIGPFKGQYATFVMQDQYTIDYVHEANYSYHFQEKLLKMKSLSTRFYFTNKAPSLTKKLLLQEVVTKTKLAEQWQAKLDAARRKSTRPNYYRNYYNDTRKGEGKLQIRLKIVKDQPQPLNILLLNPDDPNSLQVRPGSNRSFYGLKPGNYQLIFFMEEGYFIKDSVEVKANGLNYLEIELSKALKKDDFSKRVNELIEHSTYYGRIQSYYQIEQRIKQEYFNSKITPYEKGDFSISGIIVDEAGEEIPGVNIVIKGTKQGTVSDVNGKYSIKVVDPYAVLVFSYIGYHQQEITVEYQSQLNIQLSENSLAYDELVVIGYGSTKQPRKVSSSYSFDRVGRKKSADIGSLLRGKAVGVDIQQTSGISGARNKLIIRGVTSVSGSNLPLYVVNGVPLTGNQTFDINSSEIASVSTLKGIAATTLYGDRGRNGVILVTLKNGSVKSKIAKLLAEDNLLPEPEPEGENEGSLPNSIRSNFSDDAFWEAQLRTNKAGKVTFSVTFPDDVTKWDTHVYVTKAKKQSGSTRGQIRAFKPLMAKLAVPRFLIAGDTTQAIGKTLNYTGDTINLNSRLAIEGISKFDQSRDVARAVIDTLMLVAPTADDSLEVTYSLHKQNGYTDGEQRTIPIYQKGLSLAEGDFITLNGDTSLNLSIKPTTTELTLHAASNPISILRSEVKHLHQYQYLCNEQLASKLKAYLAEKTICEYLGERFKYDQDIRQAVRKLQKRQRKEGTWGWWPDSATSYWISIHVLEALHKAKSMGYAVNIPHNLVTKSLVWDINNTKGIYKLKKLQLLHQMDAEVNYKELVAVLDSTHLSLREQFQLTVLKQERDLPYQLDSLKKYQQETMFGNYFWGKRSRMYWIHDNPVLTTLAAYQVLKNDSASTSTLTRVRNYLLEKRTNGYWRNTYESAQILEVLLPDWLENKTPKATKLKLSGVVNQEVTSFPFTLKVNPQQQQSQQLQIQKTGDFPIYFTQYQRYWEQADTAKASDYFEVNTYFGDPADNIKQLTGGKKVKLTARVEVKKEADYVMIEVPIPAGCSYGTKTRYGYREVHREYFREKVSIFCQHLPIGTYTFSIELLPRYTGTYTLNPAKAEQMYFPIFYGRNNMKQVAIQGKE